MERSEKSFDIAAPDFGPRVVGGEENGAQTSQSETLDAAATVVAAEDLRRFEFRGGAAEFFRIWIVNVSLTALTLGIFSAWAKVRTNRYFYANTFLDDANFEYHARPLSILFARIIVFAVVIGGGYMAEIYLLDPIVYSLLLALFLPWALVRGLSFNARNSSYRNVRFSFRRGYGMPYLFYILMALGLGVFALPWLMRGYHSFKAGRHSLGKTQFVFGKVSVWPYIGALWLLPPLMFSFIFLSALTASTSPEEEVWSDAFLSFVLLSVVVPLFFYMQAILFLTFWRNVRTAHGAKIVCTFTAPRLAFVLFTNFIAAVFSVGLLHPWAKVRKARFLTSQMHLAAPPGVLDEIFARRDRDESALGEEFEAAEGFDFDAGLV